MTEGVPGDRELWDERYAATDLLWSAEPNRFLVEQVAGLPPGRALDLGCGEGRNAIWLAEQGWRVTALDVSTVALARARTIARKRGVDVTWIEADLHEELLPLGDFDLVLLVYMHPPGAQRQAMVRNAASLLAPGGTLLVIGHDRSNLSQGVGGPQDPDRLFTPDDILDDLASRTDLQTMVAERVTRAVSTDGGEKQAIDALVRVVRPTP